MATIIDLDEARAKRQARRAAATHGPPVFAFDLASPRAYLAGLVVAERFPAADWRPIALPADERDAEAAGLGERDRREAERRAAQLGIRFAWPQTGAPDGRAAARVAAASADLGLTREFALAASRLTFGWGRDLDDLATLAQAAGIAGVPLDTVLDAAFDPRRDAALEREAQTSSRNTISVESERRGPSLRMRV